MTTYPLPLAGLMDLGKFADASFWPMKRDELSRTAGGRTQAKDLGPALWRATFTTAPMPLAQAAAFEAAMISLSGSVGSFLAYDVRRPNPLAYPGGVAPPAAPVIYSAAVGGNAFRLGVEGFTPGHVVSPGDYLGFSYGAGPSRALHIVTAGGAANSSGRVTLDVFPAIRPGAAVGAPGTLRRAVCQMILEPGQQPPRLRDLVASELSFSAIQSR